MFDFIGRRKIWYILSLLVIIPGIISLFTQGLNLGIDFTGGNLMEFRFQEDVTVDEIRNVLRDFGLERSPIQTSGERGAIIRTRVLTEEENGKVIAALQDNLGVEEVLRNEKVGPVIGKELTRNALLALAIASVLMLIYISIRFEFKQGVAAVIALLHDVLITLGVFSLFRLEVDSAFVAAILTILGYSINDTIIIFDRIRENVRGPHKGEPLLDVINASLMQTLARSINTVLAVLFILLALYFFGGATIKTLTLALLVGITSGAYSSIFVASPLWYEMKRFEDGGDSRPEGRLARARA
ncbi:MAG: protein translocase subunit SecF [Thermoanaerobacterales bacterium]|nr:protein translocase subunit SecF [Bacillota bacterium]MDI6906800.1 protein translocase subunit SecF [Thermoanaerobacterales bacterium]